MRKTITSFRFGGVTGYLYSDGIVEWDGFTKSILNVSISMYAKISGTIESSNSSYGLRGQLDKQFDFEAFINELKKKQQIFLT